MHNLRIALFKKCTARNNKKWTNLLHFFINSAVFINYTVWERVCWAANFSVQFSLFTSILSFTTFVSIKEGKFCFSQLGTLVCRVRLPIPQTKGLLTGYLCLVVGNYSISLLVLDNRFKVIFVYPWPPNTLHSPP